MSLRIYISLYNIASIDIIIYQIIWEFSKKIFFKNYKHKFWLLNALFKVTTLHIGIYIYIFINKSIV